MIYSFERGNILEHMGFIGANAARNTSSPIAGSVDFAMIYPSGASVTFTTNSQPIPDANQPARTRKGSYAFKFKFNNTPAAGNSDLGQLGTKILTLQTTRKIAFDGVAGATTYSTGTVYCVDMIGDLDWRMSGAASLLVRIYDAAHTTLLDSWQVDISGPASYLWVFGGLVLKAQTGPNVTIQIDDFISFFSDSSSVKAPWINLQTPQTIRVPIANSATHNQFTGIGDATNKYANVDENPHNTTDFNYDGEIGVTKSQAYTYTNVASYANTVRGFSFTTMLRGSPGSFGAGSTKLILRQGSTDYQSNNSPSGSASPSFVGSGFGMRTMPDGTAITAAGLNALEFGERYNATDQAYSTGYVSAEFKPTADGATYDGSWTLTGGTPGSAYTTIDDGVTDNDADYLECNTINLKQGFNLTGTITPLTDIGDTIYSLIIKFRSRVNHNTSGSFMKIGVRIGGTDYDYDSIFLAPPSTTAFSSTSFALSRSSFVGNPATNARWTKAELEAAEFYFYIQTLGTGPTQVSNVWMQVNTASNLVATASFMEVITGDAFTENGNVTPVADRLFKRQAVNRSNTY